MVEETLRYDYLALRHNFQFNNQPANPNELDNDMPFRYTVTDQEQEISVVCAVCDLTIPLKVLTRDDALSENDSHVINQAKTGILWVLLVVGSTIWFLSFISIYLGIITLVYYVSKMEFKTIPVKFSQNFENPELENGKFLHSLEFLKKTQQLSN